MSRLRIGSVYGHGFDDDQHARLEALGFAFRPEISRFPGAQLCTFLDFASGPALELIEVEDERAYLDFALPGMQPFCPGISLVAASGAGVTSGDLRHELRDLDPYDLHVAYDGSDDPAAPGWSYLNLSRPLVPGTFTWFTELDEPRPERPPPPVHPNGVERVVGLAFDLPAARLGRLAEVSQAEWTGGALSVDCVEILLADAVSEHRWAHVKSFPLTAVVLDAPTIDAFLGAPGVLEVDLGSERAALVETNPSCWDLVIRSSAGGRSRLRGARSRAYFGIFSSRPT
jgi:hypothetical protein